MFVRRFMTIAIVAVASLAPALAAAAPAADSHCVLRQHTVTAVRPYRVEQHIGHATIASLRGADVYVQAEPGLTAEWLRLTIERHLARMQNMRDCPLDMSGVSVSVGSSGSGFIVRIAARDADQARELLRRAHLLVG